MSINFIAIGANRIIACADDRTTLSQGVASSFSDGGPLKIFPAGRYSIAGCVGIVNAGPGPSIKQRLQRLAAQPELEDSPRKLLEALRDEIRTPLFESFDPEWKRPEATLHFSAFALRRLPSGVIDHFELQFPLCDRKLLEPRIISHMEGMPTFPVSGRTGRRRNLSYCRPLTAIMALADQIDTDGADADILGSIDRVFERGREQVDGFREAVGPRIDIAAIDAGGFRWVRRNPKSAARIDDESLALSERLDWGPTATSPLRIPGNLSIGMWVKIPSNGEGLLISAGGTAGDPLDANNGWVYFMSIIGSSNDWSIIAGHDTASANINNSGSPFAAGISNDTWVYLGLSRDTVAKTYKLYVGYGDDVSLIGTYSYSDNPSSTGASSADSRVTMSYANANPTFGIVPLHAAIQENYIWARVLTLDEHADASAGNPSMTGMAWGCLMGDDPEVDISGNGGSGTVTGTTLVQGHN